MNLKTKYKILKQKAYFDRGFSILHYLRYIIAIWGLDMVQKMQSKRAIELAVIYGIICYVVGLCWFKFGWVIAEAEVGNKFNLLAIELRKKLGIRGKI